MKSRLNFSPNPFKQKSTTLVALWIGNCALTVVILWLVSQWYSLHRGNAQAHISIQDKKSDQEILAGKHSEMLQQIENLDLKTYKKLIDQFHQINQSVQTHWGRLLDDLGRYLPPDVRIVSIRPQSNSNTQPGQETILLHGEARTKEAQLQFIKTLQASPEFQDINFEVENYPAGGAVTVSFEILFIYTPRKG